MADEDDTLAIVVFVISSIACALNVALIFVKLFKEFVIPKLWRYSLLYQNVAFLALSVGLVLVSLSIYRHQETLCHAAGFFLIFGLFLTSLSFLTTGIILLSIQNPGKPSSLTKFHRNVVLVILIPEVIISAVISILPFVSDALYDKSVDFDVTCLPLRDHGQQGAAYGTLLVVIWWVIVIAVGVCDIIIGLKLWKFNNRINSAQNNVWQSQLISQGKTLIKFLLIDHVFYVLVILATTLSVYVDHDIFKSNQSWITLTSLALTSVFHGLLSSVADVMWTACCCRNNGAVKEPHRKLKKLELMKVEVRHTGYYKQAFVIVLLYYRVIVFGYNCYY